MSLEIVPLTENDRPILEQVIALDEHNPYRHYPGADRKKRRLVFATEIWDQYVRGPLFLWAALWNGTPVGLAGFQGLPWDSDQFGKKMGRFWPVSLAPLDAVVAYRVAEKLLGTVLAEARKEGMQHLSCRVFGDNFAVIHALERNNFLLMDTLVTWLYQPGRMRAPDFRCRHSVRLYEDADREAVLTLARNADFQSRFNRDPWLSEENVRAMHETWATNCCRKIMADEVLVAQSGGRVCGFLGYRKHRIFMAQTGKELWGSGLTAVSPKTPGAYVSLLHAAVTRRFAGSRASVQPDLPDLMDFETQLSNRSILKVWQAFGFRMVRFGYNYHNGNL
ncbi:GNAT family N-acetyltransferase [Desulfosudis oleivorans]|uniref:N-acetyltransferase domain-containing protein n=1 Tax=Desulfosudis oleivorans (strain DSM 6200 / JCM 39069 / Hxd3) TaxID=96561 RepID=A8ZW34_DESOH|nr:GNAT family N-acetyltransferase [Desulfosudis oleivorans]ABW68268.1 hypothetical protein Dole_2464 [Desulfosudis oleivorans Hxd3]